MNSSTLVLPPLSALYGAAIRARLAAYRNGLLSASRLDVPVISIGNITAGGTGKTPLVEWVCRALAREGRQVCILTRGYRREHPGTRVLVSDGSSVQATEKEAGDEALLLAQNLKGIAAVVSDARRVAAGKWAIEELGVNSFVLDDGFQHLQLARDLNVVTVDATDPWGGNQLLPSGRLREPLSGLERADCIVITRADASNRLPSLIAEIQKLVGNRPIFTSRMKPVGTKTLSGEQVESASLAQPLGSFCGVGNPNSFFSLLRSSGYRLVLTRAFADHYLYSQNEIDQLVAEARHHGARSLITTAKDAVKLQRFSLALPCYVLEIQIEIDEEEQFVSMIRKALH
ncbi:MAG: tetraacyldisaccharide 4'-kinase [Pyrinomonadaceae bacterium]